MQAAIDDHPVAIGAGKPRALLAMLALSEGSPVSSEVLIDGLWGEAPPATAPKMAQVYVSQLRKVLGGSGNGAEKVTRARGYELRLGEGELDVRRFERLLAQGSPRAALALWRGPLLVFVQPGSQRPPRQGAACRCPSLKQRRYAHPRTASHRTSSWP